MSTAFEFDANEYTPQTLKAGNLPVSDAKGHVVKIVRSEVKPVKDSQDGSWLVELQLQVTEGPHAGAKGPYRLNVGNASESVRYIAHTQMSALCHVTGIMKISDLTQLHDKPFRAIVELQNLPEAQEKGYTQVSGVLHLDGSEPGKGAAPAAASAVPAAVAATMVPAAVPIDPAPVQAAPAAAPAAQQWPAVQQPAAAPVAVAAPTNTQPRPAAPPWAK